jgi:outer membrane protein OmpA-like peptidoglycan-associated protein
MSNSARITLIVSLAILTAAIGIAQPPATDVEGSKDHPLVSRYPGLVITDYATAEFDEFTLPLGKVEEEKPVKSQRVEGKITRIEYAAPARRSILEIYRNYESAIRKAGFNVLFTCVNNEGCGNGAVALYHAKGNDDWSWGAGQRALSAKLARKEGDVYLSLHIGQWSDLDKGSDTVLYVVEVKPMEGDKVTVDAAALASDITATGHTAVYGIYFDTGKSEVKPESDAALQEIAKMLQQNAALKLLVVGHTDSAGALAANMDLSRRRADAVVQVLTGKYGVASARLLAQGAGPLSPVESNKTEEGRAKNRRVELVEQ